MMQVIGEIIQSDYELIIEPSLQAVELEFGISLTIHDLRGRLHYGNGKPLLPGRNLHQHACCRRNRYKEPSWNLKCGDDCFTQTEQTANKLQSPFIKLCWKGVVELVVPIFLREQHLLSILAGTFRHPGGIPVAASLPKWFHTEYAKLPLLNVARFEELSNVLRVLGNGMIIWQDNKLNASLQSGRKIQIYQFIEDHAHENITLVHLGKALGVSPSRVRHLVKEETTRNFKSLLEEERMLRARYLLLSTNNTLEAIAETVGFKNGYYFNRAFKKYFGEPPGRFRRKLQE
jgi:AraC-like DNA-binding protein